MNTEFIRRAGKYVSKRKAGATASIGGGLSLAGLVAFDHNLDKQIDGQRQWNIKQSERIQAIEKALVAQDKVIDRLSWKLETARVAPTP